MASIPTSINDLPDEVLLEILSYLRPQDLCLNIATVCERWKFLAKSVILWKDLSYHCDCSSNISRIKEVLTVAPALHSLIIRERQDASHILEFLFHIRGYLRKLILDHCGLGEDSTGLLAKIVDLYPDLESLSMANCRPLTSAGCGLIPRLMKLSELDLSNCQELSGKTVRLIADSCQHLKKLRLDLTQIDDDDIIHVINKLGKQLTTLAFGGELVTDVAYLYLKNCARLQELEVCSENMSDRGLLEGIGSLHELTSLSLIMGDNLTAEALSTFLHRSSMTSLVTLKLSCNNLGDEGLNGIAERCIHLKELAVTVCNNVTDAGISMVISHCNQLHILNLMSMKSITGEGWLTLVPTHLSHLRHLLLFMCDNVHGEYVEELVAAVPQLNVFK